MEMWSIYKKLKNVPGINRKDLMAYATIARKSDKPYRIYNKEEIVCDEEIISKQILMNKKLIRYGQKRFEYVNTLLFYSEDVDYAFYEDLLSYAAQKLESQEELICFLSNLKVTKEKVTIQGREMSCEHYGKYLNEFSYLNFIENYEFESLMKNKRNVEYQKHFFEQYGECEAIKLVNLFIFKAHLGDSILYTLQWDMEKELEEVGVDLTKEVKAQLEMLTEKLYNDLNLWYVRGNRYKDVYEN